MTPTLLLELLTEELPPKALNQLGQAFAAGIVDGLRARDFLDTDSTAIAYATPRRLALSISAVRAVAPDKSVREKILPVSVALDADGQPTAALLKRWNDKLGMTGAPPLDRFERALDGKHETFFYTAQVAGAELASGLAAVLEQTLAKLPVPKVMSYQRPNGDTVQFVRPVHGLIALHGDQIVPVAAAGIAAGRTTLGHRFMSTGELSIENAADYASVLEQRGHVIPSFSQRRASIRAALLKQAGDDQVLMPDALLDEVTALVEWPAIYECHFADEFLSVPQECLILTMQTNQKYFALTGADGRLRSRFLVVSNLQTAMPQSIIEGNQRVVRPRLADAKFFFEQDQKKTLAARLPGLASVVYHNQLGTQAERTQRVAAIAAAVATMLNQDIELARRAALLAKTDLLTDMVGEFPELQGVMGAYYARHDGEPEAVAQAISEHYQPRFAGDALPASAIGSIVALADKLETLVGIWSIGLQPTGDRDPFALRRHALGILRMLIEQRLPLSINALLQQAAAQFAINDGTQLITEISSFMLDRLRNLLRERGHDINQIEAVLALQPDRLDDLLERLHAVQAFAALPEAQALAAANKRITNILKKNPALDGSVDNTLLHESAEQELFAAMQALLPKVDAAFTARDFGNTLKLLAELRASVDAFFASVMVMADDAALRANRLALLGGLHRMMNQVADISRLAA